MAVAAKSAKLPNYNHHQMYNSYGNTYLPIVGLLYYKVDDWFIWDFNHVISLEMCYITGDALLQLKKGYLQYLAIYNTYYYINYVSASLSMLVLNRRDR